MADSYHDAAEDRAFPITPHTPSAAYRCVECGHTGDSPRDFAWYACLGGYLCLNRASCIWRSARV